MPQDHRQLRLVVHVGEDSARDVDVPTREGEGVDHRGVENPECVLQIRTVADRCELLTHVVDIGGKLRVVVETVRRHDLRIRRASHGDLLGLREQHELALAGDRVGCTRHEDEE
jgi:hypothetical protein